VQEQEAHLVLREETQSLVDGRNVLKPGGLPQASGNERGQFDWPLADRTKEMKKKAVVAGCWRTLGSLLIGASTEMQGTPGAIVTGPIESSVYDTVISWGRQPCLEHPKYRRTVSGPGAGDGGAELAVPYASRNTGAHGQQDRCWSVVVVYLLQPLELKRELPYLE
jgi:hypothetical protein